MDAPAQALIADRYRLERELGRGGMATVWLAQDVRHDRPVALKILHPDLAGAIGVDRFVREVRVAAGSSTRTSSRSSTPACCNPPRASPCPGTRWHTSKGNRSARGSRVSSSCRSTKRCASRRRWRTPSRRRTARASSTATSSPDNIFLAGGRVYVIDFGIAKALIETGGERLTSTGLAIGTPAYMSPEQASAGQVDERSDQYSLATVLYEMLTGEPPFTGSTAQAIVARRFAEPARPVRTGAADGSAPVEAAVLQALERVPADRYPDVTSFIAALRGDRGTGRRRGAMACRALHWAPHSS